MSDSPKTTGSVLRDEPLEPTCMACRESRGTCFPGPCKAYLARKAAKEEADGKRS